MLSFKNILEQTFGKITIFAIVFIIITSSIIIFWLIPSIANSLITDKKQILYDATEFMSSIFYALHEQEEKGLISKEKAQQIALAAIKNYHYEYGYFWVNNITDGTILAHPNEALIGEDFEGLINTEGYTFEKEVVNTVKTQEYGFITYTWPFNQNPEACSAQTSCITSFEPWNWMIGTSMYIDNVQKELHVIVQKIIGTFILVFLLMTGLLLFIIKVGSKIEKQKIINEQKYTSLIKHLPIAVFRIELFKDGTNSVPLLWNVALIDLFEFPSKNYIKQNKIYIDNFLVDKKLREKIISTSIKEGRVIGQEINLRTYTGKKIWVKIFVCFIKENGSRFLDISMEDITKQQKAAQLFKKSYHKLQKVTILQNEIIAVTSHELRTPLTVIKGFASLLTQERTGNLNKSQKKYLSKILKNTNLLLEMIANMLDLEKIKTGKVQPHTKILDINELILNIFNDFESRCQKEKKSLTLNLSISPLLIRTDPEKLKRILVNLIDNAVKFTHSNAGEIKIFTKQVAYDKIEIHVKDNGVGITKKDLGEIFTKFNQVQNPLKAIHTGSGLGLSIVKGLAKQLEGTINVTSIVGKGSDFYITLSTKK